MRKVSWGLSNPENLDSRLAPSATTRHTPAPARRSRHARFLSLHAQPPAPVVSSTVLCHPSVVAVSHPALCLPLLENMSDIPNAAVRPTSRCCHLSVVTVSCQPAAPAPSINAVPSCLAHPLRQRFRVKCLQARLITRIQLCGQCAYPPTANVDAPDQ